MKNIYKVLLLSLFMIGFLPVNAQNLCTFEEGLMEGTQVVDHWADSPFTLGLCDGIVELSENPFPNNMNSTAKVCKFVRSNAGSHKYGVQVKLEKAFNLSTNVQYVHVLIYKDNDTKVMLEGRGSSAPNVSQFSVASSIPMRGGAWTDAVFAVKGKDMSIDELIVLPDCETPVNRLKGDMNVYIDEIVINNSPDPRSVSDYCIPSGTPNELKYIASYVTSGAITEATYSNNVPSGPYERTYGHAIVAYPNSTFKITFKQKNPSVGQNAWNAYFYLDYNEDKEFVGSEELLGMVTGSPDPIDPSMIVFEKSIRIPSDAISGACRLRAKFSEDTNGDACDNVLNGVVYDVDLDIMPYHDRPQVTLEVQNDHSDWGGVRFKDKEGYSVKVENGLKLTAVATPKKGHSFYGWLNGATGTVLSKDMEFSFIAGYNLTLMAKFTEDPYCTPAGDQDINCYLSKASVTVSGQSPVYFLGSLSADAEVPVSSFVLKSVSGVNVPRGTNLSIDFSKAFVTAGFDGMQAAVYMDWDGDHIYSENECVKILNSVRDEENVTISIPADAQIGDTRIRLRLSEQSLTAADACKETGEGMIYDFIVNVVPNATERFTVTAEPNIAGAGTFTLNEENDTYPAGKNLEITAVPNPGFTFVQWMKDGVPYGATMTSNNPLPITVNENLHLTMKYDYAFPTYCKPTAASETHYGMGIGSAFVNDVLAFSFETPEAVNDFSATNQADICAGDELKIVFTGAATHSQWAAAALYVDWNNDGTFANDDTERYYMHRASDGEVVTNKVYTLTIPESVTPGCIGMRIIFDEDPEYNHVTMSPCLNLFRGTSHTFRLNIVENPVETKRVVRVSADPLMGDVFINGETGYVYEAEIGEEVTVKAEAKNGYEFVNWTTANNTVVSSDMEYTFIVSSSVTLAANFKAPYPDYCNGTAASRSEFRLSRIVVESPWNNFTSTESQSLNNLIQDKCLQAALGDEITFTLSSSSDNTKWGNIVIYMDWDGDGVFNTDVSKGEKYDLFGGEDGSGDYKGDGGSKINNYVYKIIVPAHAKLGFTGMRIISEEAMKHNEVNNFDPCGARNKGSVHTFGLQLSQSAVGVKNHSLNTVGFYPNPVNDKLFVTAVIGNNIDIYDLTGTLIIHTKAIDTVTEVNVNDLYEGSYIVKVNDGQVQSSSIFLKKR